MNDDRWIEALAQEKREQEAEERSRLDERWDRLSAGTLSAEEEAELLALAKTSAEARETYEAFRPLGPDFQARVVRKIRRQAWKEKLWQAIRRLGLAPAAESAKPRPPKPLPFPLLSRFAAWSTAAAAALVALMIPLRTPVPLPPYQLALTSISPTRGEQIETGKIKDFPPGHRVPMLLSPQTTAASHIWPWAAGCYLSCGRAVRRLEAGEKTISAAGAVRMQCALSRDLRPGSCTLWAVVGRWGRLPDASDRRFASTHKRIDAHDWVALGQEIRIQPPDP